MLAPKKTKYRKQFRTDQIRGKACRKVNVDFGQYGLKAVEAGFISARQIESARRAISRAMNRAGRVWIRIFPDKPVTKGPGAKMGGGKGAVDFYTATIRAGTVLFEVDGINEKDAREALRLASHKLSVKTKFVSREA